MLVNINHNIPHNLIYTVNRRESTMFIQYFTQLMRLIRNESLYFPSFDKTRFTIQNRTLGKHFFKQGFALRVKKPLLSQNLRSLLQQQLVHTIIWS